MKKSLLDEVIAWNKRKWEQATDPVDKDRYAENIRKLKEND